MQELIPPDFPLSQIPFDCFFNPFPQGIRRFEPEVFFGPRDIQTPSRLAAGHTAVPDYPAAETGDLGDQSGSIGKPSLGLWAESVQLVLKGDITGMQTSVF
ncbi:hypothetical protein LLH00_16525 [bacterium]|nr:hypothetical protein [bacterium]